jgi:hypothetical protein
MNVMALPEFHTGCNPTQGEGFVFQYRDHCNNVPGRSTDSQRAFVVVAEGKKTHLDWLPIICKKPVNCIECEESDNNHTNIF